MWFTDSVWTTYESYKSRLEVAFKMSVDLHWNLRTLVHYATCRGSGLDYADTKCIPILISSSFMNYKVLKKYNNNKNKPTLRLGMYRRKWKYLISCCGWRIDIIAKEILWASPMTTKLQGKSSRNYLHKYTKTKQYLKYYAWVMPPM